VARSLTAAWRGQAVEVAAADLAHITGCRGLQVHVSSQYTSTSWIRQRHEAEQHVNAITALAHVFIVLNKWLKFSIIAADVCVSRGSVHPCQYVCIQQYKMLQCYVSNGRICGES
jgi:hypothetical protein